MILGRLSKCYILMLLGFTVGASQPGAGQATSTDSSWSASSQQSTTSGNLNPIRTRTSHSEVGGRVIDKTVMETKGPDGRYVPYSEIERESVRVNAGTARTTERSYGNSDGQRTLTQETQEESRSLPNGNRKVTRTTSNPDGNGGLQVVQRAISESKQLSPGLRETKTTVFSADGNGGLGATVQIEEREKKTDANTIEFTKSTTLADGAGHWTLSEVREGTTRQEAGGGSTKEERVLRPDGNGKMTLTERTVSKQSTGPGQQNNTTETYSTDVPGQAGNEGLRLVQRESTVKSTSSSGVRGATRRVEQPNPGDPGAGLRVTEEAIDIVRPSGNGTVSETSTVLRSDSNGHLSAVWVDIGNTDKPAPVKVTTAPAMK